MRCEPCGGSGEVEAVIRDTKWGRITGLYPCQQCGGTGILSCCEGSERHGQLDTKKEAEAEAPAQVTRSET